MANDCMNLKSKILSCVSDQTKFVQQKELNLKKIRIDHRIFMFCVTKMEIILHLTGYSS